MKRPPYFRIITAAKDRHWVRLLGGNHRKIATSETYGHEDSAQNAIRVARVAVAVELAEALREKAAQQRNTAIAVGIYDAADLLPALAESLPPVTVETIPRQPPTGEGLLHTVAIDMRRAGGEGK